MLSLHSENGTILHIDGNTDEISSFDLLNVKVGQVSNEDTLGTCAHSLCMFTKSPIQLLGPENYCYAFQDNISSAAPILDENGNVISALVLVQAPMDPFTWMDNFNVRSHRIPVAIEKAQHKFKLNQ
jgi:transcriptional regulator of acetoin/glycerol metabolism